MMYRHISKERLMNLPYSEVDNKLRFLYGHCFYFHMKRESISFLNWDSRIIDDDEMEHDNVKRHPIPTIDETLSFMEEKYEKIPYKGSVFLRNVNEY